MRSIELTLRNLKREIDEAYWEGDEQRIRELQSQIDRLEMLQRYGETHDVDH